MARGANRLAKLPIALDHPSPGAQNNTNHPSPRGSRMAIVTDTASAERWQHDLESAGPPERPATTVSGVPTEPLYTSESLNGFDPEADLGYPGQYPFTRGVHASMNGYWPG